MSSVASVWHIVSWLMQRLTCFLLLALAATAALFTLASAFGYAQWLSWPLQLGDQTYEWAGMAVQIALSILLVGLCFFLPAHKRISQLETSHRLFQIGMEDVARAYAVAHAQDRTGAFQLSGEFDAIRERLGFMREHPDLAQLEPTILEAAAQMSHISSELASIYSDKKVARAKQVLEERQHEIVEFNERLESAKLVSTELKGWLGQVEMEESVARAQLDRLVDDLADVLPALGLEVTRQDQGSEVIALPHAAE